MDGTANGQVPGDTNDNAWPAPLLLCLYPLAGRLIREVVDLLAVYREHEPARVSDSRIRRQVAAAASTYPVPFAVPSLKDGVTTITVTSQILLLLLLFFKCALSLTSNESLISPRRSKGDDPLSLPFPFSVCFFSYTGCTMVERAATKG